MRLTLAMAGIGVVSGAAAAAFSRAARRGRTGVYAMLAVRSGHGWRETARMDGDASAWQGLAGACVNDGRGAGISRQSARDWAPLLGIICLRRVGGRVW